MTVYEYRLEIAPPNSTSPSELAAQLLAGDEKPVRTIRLPTLSDCVAHFSTGDRDKADSLAIGTILEVTAKRTSDSVLMKFNYTTASLTPHDVAGSNPRVIDSTVQGVYSFQLGEPVLLGGLTASDGFYLVATVTEPTCSQQEQD